MLRQNKHRKLRRERGLCAYEGCEVQTGDRYYCDCHGAENNERRKRRRQARKAAAQVVQ